MLDSCAASAAVFLAYELRFDFYVPPNYARGMWLWITGMALLRPLAIAGITDYRSIWRFFGRSDLWRLIRASLLPSLLLASLRLIIHSSPIANIPRGVIALEFVMFVGLACAMRWLRRAAYYETTFSRAERSLSQTSVSAPPTHAVFEAYGNRVVLVTGAGGSIGSELSQQISALGVSQLLLLDHAENSIFEVERGLRESDPLPEIVPIVGDIRDHRLLEHLFATYRPQVVLHSAAYKHVPMMETNPSEAFLNNVTGTRNLLDSALQHGSERFVMISSDKAVTPSSVMGATKRLGEMLVQSRAEWAPKTRLASVRFGNVVGSRGSVIPIFLRQIAEGKPVTVTDDRMTRYFMTIKEAVQLVLQASAMASQGEIYTLDMGDPVMISTLARKLIEMSGLRPEKDIPIEIVGVRPGEKLQERLWNEDSLVSATMVPRIHRVDAGCVPSNLEADIMELEELARERRDRELREKLRNMPIGYCQEDKFAASAGD